MKINDYYGNELSDKDVDEGVHRDAVGGMWEEIGKLQFDFLVSRGLKPDMKLIDIGCGSLRGGIHIIRYLNPDNYYGIDVNRSLVDAGYDRELVSAGLQKKLSRNHLLVDEHFNVSRLGAEFDMALAVSVFTHLPLNHIRLCLSELVKKMKPGGRFFATFFECQIGRAIEQPITHQPGGITTYTDQDPYHYRVSDFLWSIVGLPWELDYVGGWNHPRSQKMLCFTRKG